MAVAGVVALLATGLSGCGAVGSLFADQQDPTAVAAAAAESIWDPSVVHVVSVDLDEDEFRTMVETYESNDEKEWISADVTIDGATFRDAGLRLKGNSSLRSVDPDAEPAELPWLIDLDKFVDGQSLDGWESFVVRSNTTETALNEAVALDLLEEAGLASQAAIAMRFSVNGSSTQLRLLVQDLDQPWDDETFGTEGILYKSEAGGDWSYRGDQAADYEDAFDIEAGDDDYEPLAEFLQWLEESSDQEFTDGLEERLDVQSFADYLAFEDLIGNFDDIEGPGNNSFLRWDAESGRMTVVAWDHNLAFGAMGDMGPGQGGPGGESADGGLPENFEPPDGFQPPEDFEPPQGGGRAGSRDALSPPGGMQGSPGERSNVLAERFRATPEYAAMYDDALQRLEETLYQSGAAEKILATWTDLLSEQATDLVDESAIEEDASDISSYFDGRGASTSPPLTEGSPGRGDAPPS